MIIKESRTISGDIQSVWTISTDVNNWPKWDPHEEDGKMNEPFEVGASGYSKPRGGPGAHWILTQVEKPYRWSLINKMSIGTLRVENRYTESIQGKVLCERTMQVSGLILSFLFWAHFRKETRKDMHSTWIALEKELVVRN